MTRKLNTYLHRTNDLVDENHTSEEYADKQKQKSLEKAGKIDVAGFMEAISGEEVCYIETARNGNAKARTKLEQDSIYTIWYDKNHSKWCYFGKKGESNENIQR